MADSHNPAVLGDAAIPLSAGGSRAGLARNDRAEKIALFRYQLIREAADDAVTSRQRGPMVRALAKLDHPWPFGGTIRVSKDTLDRWIRNWRRDGFDGLKPKPRASRPVTPAQVLALAATLKTERPSRTAAQIRRIMIDTLGDAPSESTLLRHFRTLTLPTNTREVFGRFEANHPNEIWTGDALHGPSIAGRKTYLFAFIDDHTRLIVAARWAYAEDAVRLAAALRPAMESRGIPQTVYVDNGAAFADQALARTCARLGIRLAHSQPYRPQGRGKIERFFATVTQQFLTEITTTNSRPGQEQVGSPVTSLDELNALFTSWVEMVYHHTVHSTTGQTPLQRWEAGWANRTPVHKDAPTIAEAFRWAVTRRVTKSATVSLLSNTYQVEPALIGQRIELVYDPFDLTAPITVTANDGSAAGQAALVQIQRHVHPKAANAANDADTGAANVSTGIDYLRLVEDRHKQHMTAAPIRFDTMHQTTTPKEA